MLVALGMGACLLASAWSCVWAITSASGRTADAVEARTSLAFARRVLLADLRVAAGLATTATSSDSELAVSVPAWRQSSGLVTVCWERDRGVLWRLAPGCHLAEGVDLFQVTYLDAAGSQVGNGGEPLDGASAATVRGVVVDVRVRVGKAVASGHWPVWFLRVAT
jgi:hypothetical protein